MKYALLHNKAVKLYPCTFLVSVILNTGILHVDQWRNPFKQSWQVKSYSAVNMEFARIQISWRLW